MTTRTQEDLLKIVQNGGGLGLQAGIRSTEDLVQLVRNTIEKATVILRGVGARSAEELVQISRNSTGSVIFVFD